MDAIRLLTDDHKQVKALFREYERLSDTAHKGRQRIVERVFRELQVHTQIEEDLYPAFRAKADAEAKPRLPSLQEHHVVGCPDWRDEAARA